MSPPLIGPRLWREVVFQPLTGAEHLKVGSREREGGWGVGGVDVQSNALTSNPDRVC